MQGTLAVVQTEDSTMKTLFFRLAFPKQVFRPTRDISFYLFMKESRLTIAR